ncbi:hypothetical protein [Aeromonas caviae]|uniref:hypothetical protein n=1 Tax=Aeromonas caviae TaxID=648 RepID=UPI0030153D85
MKSVIEIEKIKREKAERLRRYATINWNVKKKEIEVIFREAFSGFNVNGREFYIDNDLNSDFSDKRYIGYDCVQVSHPLRFTGNMVITKDERTTNFDRKKEVGAALSITTSAIGSFDIFLIPAKNDDKILESKSLIIYSCKDPNKLTKKRILKSIKQYLIFQRVDSLLEYSSVLENAYVAWLYFWDARNREKYRSLLFQIMNHWGAVAVSAIAAWIIAKNTS